VSPRRTLIACLALVAVVSALTACGSGGSRTASGSTGTSASVDTQFASQTQQLCREKRTAIAGLGYVNITFGGIARVGLPKVKRSLDAYLDRLLGVLREFHQRQQRIATPPALVSKMQTADQLYSESQAVTIRLRNAVAQAKDAGQLSTAFHAWTTALQGLAARGDAVARQLNLPACRSGSAPAAP
jgi:hypothetical protein